MYTVAAALLATAALASAAPSVLKARDGCATAYLENFTLAAWNTSMPNNNGTGAPLVLGYGSEFEGNEYFTLSTYASYPYNQFPTLAMSNGVLAATGSDNRPVATAPSAGTELHFITPLEGNPDHAFCAASSSDGDNFYELSVGGDTDGWWLCPAKDSEVNVVYKPDQNHGNDYDYDRCYPVKLHIVFDDVSGRGATMMGSS